MQAAFVGPARSAFGAPEPGEYANGFYGKSFGTINGRWGMHGTLPSFLPSVRVHVRGFGNQKKAVLDSLATDGLFLVIFPGMGRLLVPIVGGFKHQKNVGGLYYYYYYIT